MGWDAASDENVVGYNVYYGMSSGLYDIVEDAGDATEYTIAGLENGQLYYLAVTSYDAEGNESDFSIEIPYTTPEAMKTGTTTAFSAPMKSSYTERTPDLLDTDKDGIPDGEERIYWAMNGTPISTTTDSSICWTPIPTTTATPTATNWTTERIPAIRPR